jgi:hypothetical protein
MNEPYITADFIGRCIDTAIPFALGIIGLLYYPRRIAKQIESGKLSEEDGKKRLKRARIACFAIMLLGVLKLTDFLK